ncbi:hypothetical protein [Vibrio harveyi]|uniref:hypothetical protein n=1 Tax=Vibrio harveyi TaxID=669 RepID=UPI00217DFD4A|nr:hypothetical protein [Vibrio harveyi]
MSKFHGFHEPTKTQEKAWLERIALFAQDYGSFPLQNAGDFELHHVKGRTAAHKKIHIGRWFVLPVQTKYHNVLSPDPLNVTHFKKRYEEKFEKQSKQFENMVATILDEDGELPFPDEVLEAVRSC